MFDYAEEFSQHVNYVSLTHFMKNPPKDNSDKKKTHYINIGIGLESGVGFVNLWANLTSCRGESTFKRMTTVQDDQGNIKSLLNHPFYINAIESYKKQKQIWDADRENFYGAPKFTKLSIDRKVENFTSVSMLWFRDSKTPLYEVRIHDFRIVLDEENQIPLETEKEKNSDIRFKLLYKKKHAVKVGTSPLMRAYQTAKN